MGLIEVCQRPSPPPSARKLSRWSAGGFRIYALTLHGMGAITVVCQTLEPWRKAVALGDAVLNADFRRAPVSATVHLFLKKWK
jgi:hypothetical protein